MGQNHVKQNVKKDNKKIKKRTKKKYKKGQKKIAEKKFCPKNFVLFLNKKALSSNTCQVVSRRKTIVSK